MKFGFTEQEERWRKEVRDFFDKEATDELLEKLEEEGLTHSQEFYLKMRDKGWFAIPWPRECGGQDRSFVEQAIFNDEIVYSKTPFGTANILRNTVYYLANLLIRFGTEEQKRTIVPMIASGELRNCVGLTEPNVGSDVAAVEMRAVADGDDYMLNGTKLYNNAYNSTHITALVKTDPNAAKKYKGLSLFLVDLKSPGISVKPVLTIGGTQRSEVIMEDVRVPKTSIIGEKNQGWYHLMGIMDLERSAGGGAGRLRRAWEDLLQFVKEARREGQPLSKIPAVRYVLADMAKDIELLDLFFYRTAGMQDRHMDVTNKEASMYKILWSESVERFANAAMEILGQYGQLERRGSSKERIPLNGIIPELYEDSRHPTIGGGTVEIQRNIIAMRGLGLPR